MSGVAVSLIRNAGHGPRCVTPVSAQTGRLSTDTGPSTQGPKPMSNRSGIHVTYRSPVASSIVSSQRRNMFCWPGTATFHMSRPSSLRPSGPTKPAAASSTCSSCPVARTGQNVSTPMIGTPSSVQTSPSLRHSWSPSANHSPQKHVRNAPNRWTRCFVALPSTRWNSSRVSPSGTSTWRVVHRPMSTGLLRQSARPAHV